MEWRGMENEAGNMGREKRDAEQNTEGKGKKRSRRNVYKKRCVFEDEIQDAETKRQNLMKRDAWNINIIKKCVGHHFPVIKQSTIKV